MKDLETLKEHLQTLEEELLKPNIRKSPEELSKLLADEFVEFASTGRMWSKKDIGSEGLSVWDMKLHDFEMNSLAPDVALATYRIVDETRNIQSLRSSVWKLIDGSWQMVFHQGTPIQPR